MKPWHVLLTGPAARDLRRIDPTAARRIKEALLRFAEGAHGDVARLQGSEDEWRLRIGTWRVRFVFDHDAHAINVLRILPRKDAYRD